MKGKVGGSIGTKRRFQEGIGGATRFPAIEINREPAKKKEMQEQEILPHRRGKSWGGRAPLNKAEIKTSSPGEVGRDYNKIRLCERGIPNPARRRINGRIFFHDAIGGQPGDPLISTGNW